jgi:ankyrin repeat protein
MSAESKQLAKAIQINDTATVQLLCQTYGTQFLRSGELHLLLQHAAAMNQPAALEILMRAGANINQPIDTTTAQTVLFSAAANGATESVRWLLTNGANVNATIDGQPRCLPLYTAIIQGYSAIVELLVSHGAVTSTTWNGQTPAECAAAYGRTDIEHYLRGLS